MEGSLRCCHVYRILPALQLPSQKIGRLAAERGIQDLNRVDYWRLLMLAREGRLQLENAARIAGGHDVGPKLRNEFGFATAEGFGCIGLNEIVDSCGAATNGGLGDFSELKARNARQQSARLRESSSERTSLMSLHFAENLRARSAYSRSSRSKCPYSFTLEPQPAALVTMVSTLARSKASIVCLANSMAAASSPACTSNAPQQVCACGATTSQPSAVSTRVVAAFTRGKNSRCTQPRSSPTRRRFSPTARVTSGTASSGVSLGSSASIICHFFGSSLVRRKPRMRACNPDF